MVSDRPFIFHKQIPCCKTVSLLQGQGQIYRSHFSKDGCSGVIHDSQTHSVTWGSEKRKLFPE